MAILAFPMATHIICPACETRYETKAVFPPEGRKVRCSKCGHVWQAQPVTSMPEPPPVVARTPTLEEMAARASPQPQPKPQGGPGSGGTGLRGFAGITQSASPAPSAEPSLSARLSQTDTDAEFDVGDDVAAQVAEINAEAAEEPA